MIYINEAIETELPLFDYHKDKHGGTEYMVRNVLSRFLLDLPKFKNYDCVVVPGLFDHKRKSSKKRIMWIHNYPYEFSDEQLQILIDCANEERTHSVIVVSETQKKNFVEKFNFPKEKMVVLPNAITPLKYDPAKFVNVTKPSLMNTSAPERGMELLLSSIQLVEEDFTLRIFNNFNPDSEVSEEAKKLANDPRVMYYGITPRPTVYKYFEQSHILAYPATWSETFCLSQVEAMSAGCLSVYSAVENSALPEISKGYGIDAKLCYTDFQKDTETFAEKLTEAIQTIKSGDWEPSEQVQYVNSTYSWEAAREAWVKFHESL